ncbi:hypothetical protein BCAH1134_C0100 (plasmid) [Bacillus cereus AH1134]|nr:hypothetical protein BCAH1134_C0100 [Bacillus cereus AH1134]
MLAGLLPALWNSRLKLYVLRALLIYLLHFELRQKLLSFK